jgi:hypothetical protein
MGSFILMKTLAQGSEDRSLESEENIPKISNCYIFLLLHWVFYLFLLRSPVFRPACGQAGFWHNLTSSIK